VLVREHRGRVVVAAGLLSLALPVLMLWRCAAHSEPSPRTGADAATTPDASPPASLVSAVPAASETASPAASAATHPSSSTPSTPSTPLATPTAPAPSSASSAAAPIIAAVANGDPRDLALLSRIERELKRDPPAAVHALIRLRASGATHGQLLSELDRLIPRDLALRVLVRRWLDEVRPDGTPAPKSRGPAPRGTHEPRVKPIERVPSP
jgi:hypothetical protein